VQAIVIASAAKIGHVEALSLSCFIFFPLSRF
jgi:hypothetical protein